MARKTTRPDRGRTGFGPRPPGGLARPRDRRPPPGLARPADGPPGYGPPPGYDQPGAYDQAAGYDQPGAYEQPYDPRNGPRHQPPPGRQPPRGRRPPPQQRPLGHPHQDAANAVEHPGDAWPEDDEPGSQARRSRRPDSLPPVAFFGAAGVIVLVAVIAAAAVFASGSGGNPHPSVTAVPKVKNVRADGTGASAYSQAASTAAFAAIATRAKDPKPLTAAEAFDPKKIVDDDAKASLRLTASSLVSRCDTAIWGEDLAGRLEQGRCTQVARAAYEDKNFDALVTTFNLADDRAADQVVADADPKAANGFPLVPPKATAFDQGFSIARGVAMGHYAVITWVRHTDGSGDERDPALLSLLVTAGKPNAVLIRAAGRDPRP